MLPRQSVPRGGCETVRVLHGRVGAQDIKPGLLALERKFRVVVSYPGERFRGLGRLEPRLRVGARPACAVELGLGLAQRAGLPPALGAGVDPVALVEALDGSCQRLVFLELAAIFLQLAQSLGDVPKQFWCERRQGPREP